MSRNPKGTANGLSTVLRLTLGEERFPLDIATIAVEVSRHREPDEPIVEIVAAPLDGFEGMLAPCAAGGWRILYNDAAHSQERVRFTLAHEFGHYLLHRTDDRPTFRCSTSDTVRRDLAYALREREANEFAATLLMPLDDFRGALPANFRVTPDELSLRAKHYGVSFTAAALRWLEYTELPAVLIASRDEFILWACSSRPALRQGAFLKTTTETIEMPARALANEAPGDHPWRSRRQGPKTWALGPRKRACIEYSLASTQYDFQLTLLLLDSLDDEVGEGAPEADEALGELTGTPDW